MSKLPSTITQSVAARVPNAHAQQIHLLARDSTSTVSQVIAQIIAHHLDHHTKAAQPND